MNTSRALALFVALALLGLVFLALSTPTARAADPIIVRVTTTGTTGWPCGLSDWSNPCALQTALGNAVSGSELWVAAGTYKPTMGADRAASFHLIDGVALYGGFAGGESLRSERNFTANVTILSGDIGAPSDSSDNAYHVIIGSGVTNTAVLDGFTVTGGRADGNIPNDSGGGMYNSDGSPTAANVTFSDNWGKNGGGMYNYVSSPTLSNVTFGQNSGAVGSGMLNDRSSPTLANVTFSGNSANNGGGMYNLLSNPTLMNVGFYGNSAYLGGAGMSNWNSSPRLTNVTFSDNSASTGGAGGMGNEYYSSPILTNTTFIGNTAGTSGGGMANITGSSPTLTNVTFNGNSATNGGAMYNYINWGAGNPTLTNVTISGNSATNGGAMYNYANSPTVRNTIFWGNTATTGSQIHNAASNPPSTAYIYDSIVQGGCPMDSTCSNIITADPRLGTLGNYGGSTQTFPLLPGSSAIDAGNDAICPPTDQRGIPRPQGAHCDIGAYESIWTYLPLIRK